MTDPRGNASLKTFAFGVLVGETRGWGTADAATWLYEVDPDTLVVSQVVDPNGHATTSTYDSRANELSRTDALGRQWSWTYGAFNNVLTATGPNPSSTGPASITTTYTYDGSGRLTSISKPLYTGPSTYTNQVVTLTRGDSSHPDDVTSVTDPDGMVAMSSYDPDTGDLLSAADPLGNTTTYGYDTVGRLTSLVPPNGNAAGATSAQWTTTITVNGRGQPLEVIGHTDASTTYTTTYTYDDDGNVATATDPNGETTEYRYDAADQLVEVERPDGTVLANEYWPDGQLKTQIDGAEVETLGFDHDAQGRLVTRTDALGQVTTFGYDPAGNLVWKADPAGSCPVAGTDVDCTHLGYDVANQLTSIDYSSSGTPDVAYTYAPNGQRGTMVDGTGTTTYTHDSLGRLTSTTDGSSATVAYEYNLRNLLTSIGYPGLGTVTRTYDDAGRLATITDWESRVFEYAYDPSGNVTSIEFPDGSDNTDVFAYDHANRVSEISYLHGSTEVAAFDYTRDLDGRLTGEASSGLPGTSLSYGYDDLNRLTHRDGIATWAYDDADNIIQTLTGEQVFNEANQLTSATSAGVGHIVAETDAPTVTAVSAVGAETSATISWSTDEATVARVDVGTTTAYGAFETSAVPATGHELVVGGLTCGTTYHYLVTATDLAGNVSTTTDATFATDACATSTVVSDDFRADTLNGSLWTFNDTVGDASVDVDGTHARISVPAGTSHEIWTGGNKGARLLQPIANGDFTIEARFDSRVQYAYQEQGVVVQQDDQNLIRIDNYSTGGVSRLYVATFTNMVPTQRADFAITPGSSFWVRVERDGNDWTITWSPDGTTWNAGATFTWAITVTEVGPYAGNEGTSPPAFTALVDYFIDIASPIIPEDAGVGSLESDDFHRADVDSSRWQFGDLVGDADVEATGTHARITVPAGTEHQFWVGKHDAARLVQPVTDDDFVIEARFDSRVQDAYQSQGMIIEQDDVNRLRIETYHNGTTPRFFVAGLSKTATTFADTALSPSSSFWLRVERDGDDWTVTWSTDGTTWTTGANFTSAMTVTAVGPYASNEQDGSHPIPEFTAIVDYFHNTAAPVAPEDAAHAPYTDTFDTTPINGGVWQLHDRVGDASATATGSHVEIAVPGGVAHDITASGNLAARLVQSITDTDLTIEANFDSQVTSAFQRQGVVVQQDDDNLVRVETYHDGTTPRILVSTVADLTATTRADTAISTSTSIWLRVERAGDDWTITWSPDGSTWNPAASFTWSLTATAVGPFAANAQQGASAIPAFTASIDSFTATVDTAPVETAYSYDSRGNRTTATPTGGTATTYTYDQANRLTNVSGPITASYAYNGDGLRTSKTVGAATNTFIWSHAEGLPLALSDDANAYIYGPDGLPLAHIDLTTDEPIYYHHDQLGSTRILTDTDGDIVGTATYDPYGNPAATTGTIAPLGYTGQYTDTETGHIYLRARYYDPTTAQFLTRDPIESVTREPYGYTGNNPINRTDPTGMDWWDPRDNILPALGEAAQDTGEFIYRNRGTIATVGAVGICLVPGWGLAACGYATAGAFAARAEQRIDEHGFSDSLRANLLDGGLTYLTFGVGGAFEQLVGPWAGFTRYGNTVGALGRWRFDYFGRLIPAGYDMTNLFGWLDEQC